MLGLLQDNGCACIPVWDIGTDIVMVTVLICTGFWDIRPIDYGEVEGRRDSTEI